MCPPDSGPTNEDILEVTKGLANQRMRMEDLGSTGWCPRGDRTSSGRQSDPQWMAVASQSWAPRPAVRSLLFILLWLRSSRLGFDGLGDPDGLSKLQLLHSRDTICPAFPTRTAAWARQPLDPDVGGPQGPLRSAGDSAVCSSAFRGSAPRVATGGVAWGNMVADVGRGHLAEACFPGCYTTSASLSS